MSQGDAYQVADPGGFFPQNPDSPKSKTPPQADYIGAAKEQGTQNIALAKVNAMLNNPNIKNALGQQKVTFDPVTGMPNIEQALNPTQQGIFDTLQGAQSGVAGQAATNLSKPLDYSNVSGLADKAQEAILSRLEPQFTRDEDALRTRLANQGITEQSNPEAFGKDIDTFNRAKTDARLQAVLSGLQYGPSLLQQDVAIRDQPLNEANAIATGTKTALPQFAAFNPSANAKAGDFQSATDSAYKQAMDAFNYQNAMQQKTQQGLMSGASLAALAFV